MSALSEAKLAGLVADASIIPSQFAIVIWYWFNQHQNDSIYTIKKKIWIFPISLTLYVRDLRALFELLAGPEVPTTQLAAASRRSTNPTPPPSGTF